MSKGFFVHHFECRESYEDKFAYNPIHYALKHAFICWVFVSREKELARIVIKKEDVDLIVRTH